MSIKKKISKNIRKLFSLRFFELIICQFSQNKSLNSLIGKLVPENTFYKSNSIRYVKRDGIYYCLDISDYQNWLIYFGLNEDRPFGLYDLVKDNFIIIDVGSNIGQTAMTLANMTFDKAIIYGFEPDPVNFEKAIKNLKLNTFRNIKYQNIGLGAKKGELFLRVDTPTNRGGNRIDQQNKSENSIEIKIERLDDLVLDMNIEKIDLIKIDVEGFELEVLKGAENVLRKHKPLLFIEVDDKNLLQQGASSFKLINFLNNIGYKCVNTQTTKIVNDDSLELKNCHFDIKCSYA